MDWEAHRKHLLSKPSSEGLAMLAEEISPGSRPVRSRRLGGGLGAATHAVDIRTKAGRTLNLVLKRFQAEERRVKDEWERLTFATRVAVNSPEPVAFDSSGTWFGGSAFVMTRLPGRPYLRPSKIEPWLEQIALTLIRIHDTSLTNLPPPVRRFRKLRAWQPPEGLKQTPLVTRCIEIIETALPSALGSTRVIGHGDFHPGNLVWSRGRLTGVIDWAAAQLSLRSFDVAYCRTDLTVLMGWRYAELFREIYEDSLGQRVEDLWVWDLVCGLSAMRWGHLWVTAYGEQGRRGLTQRHVAPRVSVLLRHALADN